MIARSVCKLSFWIGMAAVAAIPLVPFVYRWLHPRAQPNIEPGVMGVLLFALLALRGIYAACARLSARAL